MSRFRRFELVEEPFCYSYSSSSPLFFGETSIVVPTKTLTFPSFIEESCLDLDLFDGTFDAVADLVVPRSAIAFRRVQQRFERQLGTDLFLQSLSDRVAELEYRFDRLLAGKRHGGAGDRKYTWTAEIKGAEKNGFDRKYKWVAEIVEQEKKAKAAAARNIKWTAEIKGKGEESGSTRKYTFQVESGDAEKKKEKEKEKGKEKEKEKNKKGSALRIVEIEEPSDHRAVVLRQVWSIAITSLSIF